MLMLEAARKNRMQISGNQDRATFELVSSSNRKSKEFLLLLITVIVD